jgi:DNA-directed RNA polymerase specialized sigma24 family protein
MTITQAAVILNVAEGTVRAYARPRAKEKIRRRLSFTYGLPGYANPVLI